MTQWSSVNRESAPMQDISRAPTSVRVVWAWFILIAAIWILVGALNLIRMVNGTTGHVNTVWIVSILMFANACVMLWIGRGIRKQNKQFYYLAIVVLTITIILTVIDEFGIFDFITLIIHLGLLGLLITTRTRYSSMQAGNR